MSIFHTSLDVARSNMLNIGGTRGVFVTARSFSMIDRVVVVVLTRGHIERTVDIDSSIIHYFVYII